MEDDLSTIETVIQTYKEQPLNILAKIIAKEIKKVYCLESFQNLGVDLIYSVLDETKSFDTDFLVKFIEKLAQHHRIDFNELQKHLKKDYEIFSSPISENNNTGNVIFIVKRDNNKVSELEKIIAAQEEEIKYYKEQSNKLENIEKIIKYQEDKLSKLSEKEKTPDESSEQMNNLKKIVHEYNQKINEITEKCNRYHNNMSDIPKYENVINTQTVQLEKLQKEIDTCEGQNNIIPHIKKLISDQNQSIAKLSSHLDVLYKQSEHIEVIMSDIERQKSRIDDLVEKLSLHKGQKFQLEDMNLMINCQNECNGNIINQISSPDLNHCRSPIKFDSGNKFDSRCRNNQSESHDIEKKIDFQNVPSIEEENLDQKLMFNPTLKTDRELHVNIPPKIIPCAKSSTPGLRRYKLSDDESTEFEVDIDGIISGLNENLDEHQQLLANIQENLSSSQKRSLVDEHKSDTELETNTLSPFIRKNTSVPPLNDNFVSSTLQAKRSSSAKPRRKSTKIGSTESKLKAIKKQGTQINEIRNQIREIKDQIQNMPKRPSQLNEDVYDCCEKNDLESIQYLVYKNKQIIHNRNSNNSTPLTRAAISNSYDVCRFLIDSGSDIHAKTLDDNTPLHFACWYGYFRIARLLVESGASINMKNKKGNTPLRLAKQKNHTEIVSYLLSKGAH